MLRLIHFINCYCQQIDDTTVILTFFFAFLSFSSHLQRGSDELLSQAAVMAPASDNNNQDLATKKAKLDSTSTVLGGVGTYHLFLSL